MGLERIEERTPEVYIEPSGSNHLQDENVVDVAQTHEQRRLDFNSPAAALAMLMLVDTVNQGHSIEVVSSGVILMRASLRDVSLAASGDAITATDH